MTWATWAWLAMGWAVGVAGALLIVWALFGDALRSLRRGRTRRCPRCWYSMEGISSRRCPECGREAKRERRLLKSRRRWRWVAVGVVVLAAGFALHATPGVRERGWISLVPDRALVSLYFREERDWRVEGELHRRLFEGTLSRGGEGTVVAHILQRLRSGGSTNASLLANVGLRDPRTIPALVELAAQGAPEARSAAISLVQHYPREVLAPWAAELRAAFTAAARDPQLAGPDRKQAISALTRLAADEATLDLLRDLTGDAAVDEAARYALMELTPDAAEAEALAQHLSLRITTPFDAPRTLAAIAKHRMRAPWAMEFVAVRIARTDPDEEAIRLAGMWRVDEPIIIEALQQAAARHTWHGHRRGASVALDAIRGGQTYLAGVAAAFETGDQEAKAWAMYEAAMCALTDPEAVEPRVLEAIGAGLRSGDPDVYTWASHAAALAPGAEERFKPQIARRRWSFDPRIRAVARNRIRELEAWWGWRF